ncbi:MAG: hypothetical protein R3C05_22255 [Pirellulaceae bacterium]
MISREDRHLYKITESVDDAVAEIERFYRVYHSMRYVSKKLVLRLQKPLSPEKLKAVNSQFADILVQGTFKQTDALPEEQSEVELADLPRLVFHFNRRSLARLRMLIDFLNMDA